jgi:hypothetical protein
MRLCVLPGLVLLGMAGGLLSQPGEKLKSGPQPGAVLPGPFPAINVNGEAKGRPRCLVTFFGPHPTVLVFAREPAEGKEGALAELLKKLDAFVAKHRARDLRGGVIFLSGDARDIVGNPNEQDQAKLVEEAQAREALILRLEPRAKDLKEVIVACHQALPKYMINDKAEVTVIYYRKQQVEANWAFAPAQLKSEDVDAILKTVDKLAPKEMDEEM